MTPIESPTVEPMSYKFTYELTPIVLGAVPFPVTFSITDIPNYVKSTVTQTLPAFGYRLRKFYNQSPHAIYRIYESAGVKRVISEYYIGCKCDGAMFPCPLEVGKDPYIVYGPLTPYPVSESALSAHIKKGCRNDDLYLTTNPAKGEFDLLVTPEDPPTRTYSSMPLPSRDPLITDLYQDCTASASASTANATRFNLITDSRFTNPTTAIERVAFFSVCNFDFRTRYITSSSYSGDYEIDDVILYQTMDESRAYQCIAPTSSGPPDANYWTDVSNVVFHITALGFQDFVDWEYFSCDDVDASDLYASKIYGVDFGVCVWPISGTETVTATDYAPSRTLNLETSDTTFETNNPYIFSKEKEAQIYNRYDTRVVP